MDGFIKKNRKAISTILLLLVVAGALAAAMLFRGEDAREFYFKAESRNFRKYSDWLKKSYAAFEEKQKPYKTTPYKRHTEITADLASGGRPFGLGNADRIYDLIKRCKLVTDTQRQPAVDTAVCNASLLMERVPFADATVFTGDGRLYLTIPVLMPDKYFSVDLNRIDDVYDRFSVPVRPKRLVNAADIAETLKFDGRSFDEAAGVFGRIFSETIGKDSVKYGDSRELVISGKKFKGREVTVSLDEAATSALLQNLLTAAASEDALIDFTYGNIADISSMLDDAGLFRLFEYMDQTGVVVMNENEKRLAATLNIKKDVEGFKNILRTAFDGYTAKSGLNMALVIDKDGNILDRRLSFDLAAKNGALPVGISIHTGFSNDNFQDCRNRFITIEITRGSEKRSTGIENSGLIRQLPASTNPLAQTQENPGSEAKAGNPASILLSIVPSFEKPDTSGAKGSIMLNVSTSASDGEKSNVEISLDISGSTDPKTLKISNIIGFRARMAGTGGAETEGGAPKGGNSSEIGETSEVYGMINGELDIVSWSNKKFNSVNHTAKLSINADLPSFGIKGLSAVIDIACEDRMGVGQVALPAFRQDQIINLNTADNDEIERLKREAAASFGSFYITNKPIFDAILGK